MFQEETVGVVSPLIIRGGKTGLGSPEVIKVPRSSGPRVRPRGHFVTTSLSHRYPSRDRRVPFGDRVSRFRSDPPKGSPVNPLPSRRRLEEIHPTSSTSFTVFGAPPFFLSV